MSFTISKWLKKYYFLRFIFCLTPNLFNTFQECQHYEYKNFPYGEIWPQRSSMVIYDHCYAKIFLAHSLLIYIMKTQYFSLNYIWPEMSLLCYGEALWLFYFKTFLLITILTYVLMDNFWPYFPNIYKVFLKL